MMPPVGKSGPMTCLIRSRSVALLSAISARVARATSTTLCGGMLVAMPTAMPLAPLASRYGNAAGSTAGSVSESS